ncbi:MAG: hypothetical protein A4E69_00553 [Syntrophus sp. PtaB.Bin138]|nr:MAG: hypothetical protein A4E69_00553 [Syntrophus sp. PtaB.Bin138]
MKKAFLDLLRLNETYLPGEKHGDNGGHQEDHRTVADQDPDKKPLLHAIRPFGSKESLCRTLFPVTR